MSFVAMCCLRAARTASNQELRVGVARTIRPCRWTNSLSMSVLSRVHTFRSTAPAQTHPIWSLLRICVYLAFVSPRLSISLFFSSKPCLVPRINLYAPHQRTTWSPDWMVFAIAGGNQPSYLPHCL